jgi:hypothetical protein
MGFRKDDSDEEVTAEGRYVVEHTPTLLSGKGTLQMKLDQGSKKGWKLVNIVDVPNKSWLLIIWERPT